jgi:hypothetical protein
VAHHSANVKYRSARIILFIIGLLLLGGLYLRSANTDELHTIKPFDYELKWNIENVDFTDGVLKITTNLGYELELTKAEVKLASFELVACEHEHASLLRSMFPKAAAGHSSGTINLAKIDDIETLDLVNPETKTYSGKLDEPSYCTFHQVFGVTRNDTESSLSIQGRFRNVGTSWQEISVKSNYSYGENTSLEIPADVASRISFTYNLSAAFDNVIFANNPTEKDVAKQVFENIIQSTEIRIATNEAGRLST